MTIPNTVPLDDNRLSGPFSSYAVTPSRLGRMFMSPQPPTNRAQQFIPPAPTPGGGGGGGD